MTLNPQQRLIIVVCAIIAIAALCYAFVPKLLKLSSTQTQQAVKLDQTGLPFIGNPNAPNKILVIEDLKCYGCMIYNTTLYPQLKSRWIDTGKASYHILLLSFLRNSEPAANTAFCLRDQKEEYFNQFVHYSYEHQPPETKNWATPSHLLQMAKAATPNANMSKLSQCMLMNAHNGTMANNLKRAGALLHNKVRTPTMFVNGHRIKPLSMATINAQIH